MPATTPRFDLRYPLDTDPINVAVDIQRLAQDVDNILVSDDLIQTLDNTFVLKGGDTMRGMLVLPPYTTSPPSSVNHAVQMGWVRDNFLRDDGDVSTGTITYATSVVDAPAGQPNALMRRSWIANNFVNVDGSSVMSGPLNMGPPGNRDKIVNLADPTDAHDAANMGWVNGNFMSLGGETVKDGAIIMGGPPNSGVGVRIDSGGVVNSSVNTAGTPNMTLRRGSSADSLNETFIDFRRPISGGASIGQIRINPDNTHTQYLTTSDYRMKESDGPIQDACDRVRAIARKAFRGHWKDGTSGQVYDFINAHDVAEVAPYAVTGEKDGEEMQMVAYGDLVPLLAAALGAALERIDRLERRVA